MKKTFEAILSRTTADMLKSKQLSPEVVQLVLEVYMKPYDYAEIIEKLYDKQFKVILSDE